MAARRPAGVLISDWNQIVQFLKQIAMLQAVTTCMSVFLLTVATVTGQPNQVSLAYTPVATGRTYTVQFDTNLVSGVYTNLTGFTGPQTNGNQVTLTTYAPTVSPS